MFKSFRNRLYYDLKPFVPQAIRHAVRRWFAVHKRRQVGEIWPILPGSERAPEGWPGWPDGKRFAVVLTHDVERIGGLQKCRQLMELEMRMGFRSSFNFVPEGDYRVSREFREELVRNGFEVGVHDLRHDGKLYRTREAFARNAERINGYLKEWGAVGFRSGFMLHNLDWLRDLDVAYDLSTFDTDPFEPQPDGAGTIFPFWVPKAIPSPRDVGGERDRGRGEGAGFQHFSVSAFQRLGEQGYIELPYSLPADSTLFLLLREKSIAIWERKLEWIARHGGMALLNTHPDYMNFAGRHSSSEFPVRYYEQFLEHIRTHYAGQYWHALPREVAAYAARFKPALPRAPKRVCMVAYSSYKNDARITRYAEALVERGDHVDVLALQSRLETSRFERIGGVNVFRLQARFGKRQKSRLGYLFPSLKFLARSSWWLMRQHLRQPYDVIHVHNVPDFLVFAAAFPKLLGCKVILDIHDILPEFYGSKFSANGGRAVSLLRFVERVSSRVADHVIISNDLWFEKYRTRTGANGKCSVFINNVDARIFAPRPRTRQDNRQIVIFPGGLQWHQGVDIAIRAFNEIREEFPQAEFHIYGDGNMKEEWMALTRELRLEERVKFLDPLPLRAIADVMANADVGVVPKRADSFGNEAYSTKIMEMMCVGVPVVASETRIDRFYFNDSVVRFFKSGDHRAMAAAIAAVLRSPELRRQLIDNARSFAATHSWDSRRGDYLNLVDSICAGENRPSPAKAMDTAGKLNGVFRGKVAVLPQED